MAGIGIKLNKIYDKNTITASMYGIAYSTIYTIAPMIIIMVALVIMYQILGFESVAYTERELFSSCILYMFIFSMITSSPFSPVISKYQADRIYEKKYEDIRPSIYVGITTNLVFSSIVAIPFCMYAVLVSGIAAYYIFTAYIGYLACCFALNCMSYNYTLKEYKSMFWIFLTSIILAIVSSIFFNFVLNLSITYSMLLAITIGFIMIAVLELANALKYFPHNSGKYKEVLYYYKRYWKMMASNFLYTFGLYAHNFVFWGHATKLVVLDTFVSNQSYDTASFLALLTSITSSIFLISKVEMSFDEKYKDYMEAVIGGKLGTIRKTKSRMFRELSLQLVSITNSQFVISIVIFFLALIVLPKLGFSGMILDIYPLLAVGYYISSLMSAEILFMNFFDDLNGGLINGIIYAGISFAGSLLSSRLGTEWYGLGFVIAALSAFTFSYFRLGWMERNIDSYIFCRGNIIKQVNKEMPSSNVYSKYGKLKHNN